MNAESKYIGEIDFRDIKVKVYYYPYFKNKPDIVQCAWRMRNPDSYYQGVVYLCHKTGKLSYPEGAVIPEQTPEDTEILPKFIIVGKEELDSDFVALVMARLESEYTRKNKMSVDSDAVGLTKDEEKDLCLRLRNETGVALMDCRFALKDCGWNIEKAKDILRNPKIGYMY